MFCFDILVSHYIFLWGILGTETQWKREAQASVPALAPPAPPQTMTPEQTLGGCPVSLDFLDVLRVYHDERGVVL
jgi:hypothetical protein